MSLPSEAQWQIDELAEHIQTQTVLVRAARGTEQQRLQSELSLHIMQQVQSLVAQGVPVQEVQERLRAATENRMQAQPLPPLGQNDAPARTKPNPQGKPNEPVPGLCLEDLDESWVPTTYFLPFSPSQVAAFAAGRCSTRAFLQQVCAADGRLCAAAGLLERLGLPAGATGGEVVVDAHGNALLPQAVELAFDNGEAGVLADPMGFQSPEDVQQVVQWLDAVTQKTLRKRLPWRERALANELYALLGALRVCYKSAEQRGFGMLVVSMLANLEAEALEF